MTPRTIGLAPRARVGVLDWGIGGMDFYARLRALRPDVSVVYLSDTGAPPYGTLDRSALAARVARATRFLGAQRVTDLVVACNAASTVVDATDVVRAARDAEMRVTGVIEPALGAVRLRRGASVGVLGGRRTILSRAYQRPLAARGLLVRQRIGQPLSALVERGALTGPEVEAAVARALGPMPTVDTLVVACTHYMALLPLLRTHHAGPIVDPTTAALDAVLGRRARSGAHEGDRGGPPASRRRDEATFFTTGDPVGMRRAARLAFGVEIEAAHAIDVALAASPSRGGGGRIGPSRRDARYFTDGIATISQLD